MADVMYWGRDRSHAHPSWDGGKEWGAKSQYSPLALGSCLFFGPRRVRYDRERCSCSALSLFGVP